jgi:hypothetical protein
MQNNLLRSSTRLARNPKGKRELCHRLQNREPLLEVRAKSARDLGCQLIDRREAHIGSDPSERIIRVSERLLGHWSPFFRLKAN